MAAAMIGWKAYGVQEGRDFTALDNCDRTAIVIFGQFLKLTDYKFGSTNGARCGPLQRYFGALALTAL